jgi:hypothetical protein
MSAVKDLYEEQVAGRQPKALTENVKEVSADDLNREDAWAMHKYNSKVSNIYIPKVGDIKKLMGKYYKKAKESSGLGKYFDWAAQQYFLWHERNERDYQIANGKNRLTDKDEHARVDVEGMSKLDPMLYSAALGTHKARAELGEDNSMLVMKYLSKLFG